MRILFLSDARSYHTQRWVDYFVDSGHQCFLITLDRGLETKAEELFIPAKLLPNFLKYPFSAGRIKGMAQTLKPDLVNAHFVPSYGFIGALLKCHPLVISTWGSDVLISPRKSWLHKKRAQYILGRAELVTADAQVTAEAVCGLGVERGRVLVSPMGIERSLLGQQHKEQKPYLLVLSNRRLEQVYDLATLIKAIPLVIGRTRRKLKFILLGDGPQKGHLLNLAIKLKVEDQVEFKGVVSREVLLRHYRDSEIYVSTSLSDSTSVSLLEAMNFGLIPVVTDIPGNREWIQEDKNGFLFPTSDPQALADKIIQALDQWDRWPTLRENSQAAIRERAVWEDNMRMIEERFSKLINSFA